MRFSLLFLLASFSLAGCATLQQNVDARKLLAECQYEFAGVKLDKVTFSGLVPHSADLIVKVKISNPNDRPVALDHATFQFYNGDSHLFDARHDRFVQISPSGSKSEPIKVTLPLAGVLELAGKRPEVLDVHATLWVTLLIGDKTWETPLSVPFDFRVPLPWDQIDRAVAKKAKALKDQAEKAAKQLLGKGKKS